MRRAVFPSSIRDWFASQKDVGKGFPILFALLTLLPFYSLLIPNGKVIPFNIYSDYTTYQLPIHEFVCSEIRAGRFPHWIPNLACGLPLHATQQAAICYPLLTPFILVFGANYGIKVSLFLHMAITFTGTYRLARLLNLTRLSSTFASTVSTQSAFLIAHLMEGHVSHVFAYALAPWFFWAVIRLLRSPSAAMSLALCWITSGLLLTGQPQLPYYCLLFGSFWWLASWLVGEGSTRRWRRFVWTGVAALNCLLLVSVQWLPILELLQNSLHTSERGTLEYANIISLDGTDLLLWLVPNFWGNEFIGLPEFHSPYYFHERVGYLGLITLFLSAFSLTRQNTCRWQWGIVGLTALGILISLGDSTSLFPFLVRFVPGLGYFRCPGRVQSMLAILIPLLAAKGLDGLIVRRSNTGSHRQLSFCVLMLYFAINAWLFMVLDGLSRLSLERVAEYVVEHNQNQLWLFGLTLTNAILTLGLVLSFRVELPRIAFLAVLLASQLDLLSTNVTNFQLTPPQPLASPPAPSEGPKERVKYVESDYGVTTFRSESIRYSKSVPLAIEHDLVLIGTNEGGVLPQATENLFQSLEENAEISLQLTGCDYSLTSHKGHWAPIKESLPDFFFLPDIDPSELNTQLKSLSKTQFEYLVDQISVNQPHVISQTTHSIDLELATNHSGTLVISQTFYPCWECKVDGKDHPIESAFGVFQAILISEGKSVISIVFNPRSFYWGLRFFFVGLALSAVLLIAERSKLAMGRSPDSNSYPGE